MDWRVPKIWQGGDCWIFGGGSSIMEQFDVPVEVCKQVYENTAPLSILTPYLERIKDKHIIAINAAYKSLPFADMVFFGDYKFFRWNKQTLLQFPKPIISSSTELRDHKRVKYLGRDNRKPRGISLRQGYVSWNTNSGSAAISIAVQAGAKRIFLLGFDMHRQGGKKHFHNDYAKPERIERTKKTVTDNFDRHLLGFPVIKRDAKELGIEIYNVNPNSKIKQFPKLTLKEALCQ